MQKLLPSPIDAGQVRLADIELIESKYIAKEVIEGKTIKNTYFKRKWKFFVENRRPNTIKVSFHFNFISRDEEKTQKDEFVIEEVESFTSVGSIYQGKEGDMKLILESMRIEEEGVDTEIVPLEVDLGYTGNYSNMERRGIQVGKFLGKVTQKATDYFKENKE